MTARNPDDAGRLRFDVREHLIAHLRDHHPGAPPASAPARPDTREVPALPKGARGPPDTTYSFFVIVRCAIPASSYTGPCATYPSRS